MLELGFHQEKSKSLSNLFTYMNHDDAENDRLNNGSFAGCFGLIQLVSAQFLGYGRARIHAFPFTANLFARS
jgi:hypothetical protein